MSTDLTDIVDDVSTVLCARCDQGLSEQLVPGHGADVTTQRVQQTV